MLSIYRLPNQLPGESIAKIIRKDVFIFIKKIFFFSLLAILPLAFIFLMSIIYPALLIGEISFPLLSLAISAYYLFIWLFSFFSFIDYYLDVTIITNKRIIDIDQEGFFSRKISEQHLERVQDVSSEVHGFFPTIFRYGNVRVQTAGAEDLFLLTDIPNPEEVRNLIIKLAE